MGEMTFLKKYIFQIWKQAWRFACNILDIHRLAYHSVPPIPVQADLQRVLCRTGETEDQVSLCQTTLRTQR